jgi:alkanesulfonate monooxygenase SsuD/methylene tetrahydromethanopterin reductase-like flavin-dependent oxidoreductase (luciferase family)
MAQDRVVELGICVRDLPTRDVVGLARTAEACGYRHLFLPEAGQIGPDGRLTGRDPFLTLAAVFEATGSLIGSVGVAPTIFHRMPQLALRAATLAEQSGGRFQLGIGVSHREAAARMGVSFPASPLGHVRDALDELHRQRDALAFGADFPLLVGALGPKMVALGMSAADGVVLNWLSPTAAADTVAAARAAAPPVGGGSRGRRPTTVLYVRIADPTVLRTDADNYDRMVNYHRHFAAQGLATPEAIVAATCLPAGDLGAARAMLDAYAGSGLDVVCLYLHGLADDDRSRILEALAPGT